MPANVEARALIIQQGLEEKHSLLEELRKRGILGAIHEVAEEKWNGCEPVIDFLSSRFKRGGGVEVRVVPPYRQPYARDVEHVLVRYGMSGEEILEIIGSQITFEGPITEVKVGDLLVIRGALGNAFDAPRRFINFPAVSR